MICRIFLKVLHSIDHSSDTLYHQYIVSSRTDSVIVIIIRLLSAQVTWLCQ